MKNASNNFANNNQENEAVWAPKNRDKQICHEFLFKFANDSSQQIE